MIRDVQEAGRDAAPPPAPNKPRKTTSPRAATKPAAKPLTKARAKPAAKPAEKPSAKPMTPVKPAKAKPVARVKAEKVEPTPPVKAAKVKLVRDSFTMPSDEYAVLGQLKQRGLSNAHHAKKSELLRAGVKLLAGLSDAALLRALTAVPAVKTGRPKAKKGE